MIVDFIASKLGQSVVAKFSLLGATAVALSLPLPPANASSLKHTANTTALTAGAYSIVYEVNGIDVDTIGESVIEVDVSGNEITLASIAEDIAGVSTSGGGSLSTDQANQLIAAAKVGPLIESGAFTAAALNNSGLATPANVTAAKDEILTAGNGWTTATGFNTVAPNNAGIADLLTRLTAARAAKLDLDLAHVGNAATFRATGFATSTNVTSARDSVIVAGDARWRSATGFNTTTPNNALLSELTGEFRALLTANKLSFNSAALQFAPTGSGGASALTSTQADQLADAAKVAPLIASGAFTSAALANTPAPNLSSLATTANVTSASNSVIAAGDARWQTATGFNTTAPDNAGVGELLTRLSAERAAQLDKNIAHVGNADSFKADISTLATPAQVTAAKDAVVTAGDARWQTANLTTLEESATDFQSLLSNDKTSYTATALQLAPSGSGGGSLTTNQAEQLSLAAKVGPLIEAGQFTTAALVNASGSGGLLSDERNHLLSLPAAPLLAADYDAPDNAGVGELLTRLSAERAAKLDRDLAHGGNADDYKASVAGLATTSQLTSARDAVVTAGDARWQTAAGFNTIAPDNTLLSELTSEFRALLTANKLSFNMTTLVNTPDTSSGDSGGLQADERAHLLALPLNPLLADDYDAPDNESIAALVSRLPESRLVKLDRDLAHVGNASVFKAQIDLSGSEVNVDLSNVFTKDDGAALAATVDTIAADAEIVRKITANDATTALNGTAIDIYDDDGSTVFYSFSVSPSLTADSTRTRRLIGLPNV